MENKLLPCPFCGGEAELDEYCGKYVVFCKNASCSWRKTKAEAIEAWNTRHERTLSEKDALDVVYEHICGDGYDADGRAKSIIHELAKMCGAKVVGE